MLKNKLNYLFLFFLHYLNNDKILTIFKTNYLNKAKIKSYFYYLNNQLSEFKFNLLKNF